MIGIYATLPPSPHTHGNPAQGGQLNPEIALNPQPKTDFGDGSDGDVVIAGTVGLSKDMQYGNLTVPAGGGVYPHGFVIRVKGKMTIAAGGAILGGGNIGQDGSHEGLGPWAGGGINISAGCRTQIKPIAGGGGGDLDAADGVANSAGGVAPAATLPYSALFPLYFINGGGGGGGGSHGTNPTAGIAPVAPLVGPIGGNGGAGSGAGADKLYGAGGGGGGGYMEIHVNEIDNAGMIYSNGGKGGEGVTVGANKSGNGGGGAGGSVLLHYRLASGAGLGSITAPGGAAGTAGNGGTAGANGIVQIIQG